MLSNTCIIDHAASAFKLYTLRSRLAGSVGLSVKVRASRVPTRVQTMVKTGRVCLAAVLLAFEGRRRVERLLARRVAVVAQKLGLGLRFGPETERLQ